MKTPFQRIEQEVQHRQDNGDDEDMPLSALGGRGVIGAAKNASAKVMTRLEEEEQLSLGLTDAQRRTLAKFGKLG